MMYFNLRFFNKNYKNISVSESSDNLLSSVQNMNQSVQNSPNKLVKKDSIEFSDFEQAIILDNNILDNNIKEFADFDNDIFINDSNFIEDDIYNYINTEVDNIINDIIDDIIIKDEVKNTVNYLINYCEDFYLEYKYELVGYITNLLYKENDIVYVVRVNDAEQFKQFKIKTYNIIGIEGIFYWNEKSILNINDKVLVECTYIGNSCKYKLNKIIKKL
jgi:hypothetical protein